MSGAGSILTEVRVPTQRELTRKKKLYEQGQKVKCDKALDEIELERNHGEFTFVPNSTIVATLRKKSMTPSGMKTTQKTIFNKPVLKNNTKVTNNRSSCKPTSKPAPYLKTTISQKAKLPVNRENCAPFFSDTKKNSPVAMKSIAELKETSDLDGQSDDEDEIADETRPLQQE